MHVTKDVVRDLLPAYLANEASAGTCALVESFAAADAEFAQEMAAMRAGAGSSLPPTPPPPTTAEKLALDETRRQLRARTSTMVAGVFFTLLPLSFVVHDGRVTYFLVRDAPVAAAVHWLTAAIMWGWHLVVRRRLRVTGL